MDPPVTWTCFLCVLVIKTSDSVDVTTAVCEGKPQTISCQGKGQNLIQVTDGKYGRFDYTTCVHPAMKTTNCNSANSKAKIVQLCHGKETCFLNPSNGMFGGDPCPGTYKYAVIVYNCGSDGLYVRSTAKVIYGREKLRKKEKPATTTTVPPTTPDVATSSSAQHTTSTTRSTTDTSPVTSDTSTTTASTSEENPTLKFSSVTSTPTDITTTSMASCCANNSSTDDEMPSCNCVCVNVRDEETGCLLDDSDCAVNALREKLIIPVKSLSSFKNKKISAPDERTSSKVIGVTGVLLLTFSLSLIVIPDALKLLFYVYYSFKRKTTLLNC